MENSDQEQLITSESDSEVPEVDNGGEADDDDDYQETVEHNVETDNLVDVSGSDSVHDQLGLQHHLNPDHAHEEETRLANEEHIEPLVSVSTETSHESNIEEHHDLVEPVLAPGHQVGLGGEPGLNLDEPEIDEIWTVATLQSGNSSQEPEAKIYPGSKFINPVLTFINRHKLTILIVILVLFLIAFVTGLSLGLSPSICPPESCIALRVMSFSVWGVPEIFGGKFKPERIRAIADEIAKGSYDIYLIQGLWMEEDHSTIEDRIPENYTMTTYRELAYRDCDGTKTPNLCSGLSIISKFPMTKIQFSPYDIEGDGNKSNVDGDWWAHKGIGKAQIQPKVNLSIDVFTTHLAADPRNDESSYSTNKYYRLRQTKELVRSHIEKSTADFILLGGDFNQEPDLTKGTLYSLVTGVMTNCVQELYSKWGRWLESDFATYGNPKNTFSATKHSPVTYDYIFYKANSEKVKAHTDIVWISTLQTSLAKSLGLEAVNSEDFLISLSDHEAIASTIHVHL